MDRRTFVSSAILAPLWFGLSGCGAGDSTTQAPAFMVGPDGRRRIAWRNWSGLLQAYPSGRATPENDSELATLLRDATAPIRPLGAGHSFSPLVPTDGTLVSLRHFDGLYAHDALATSATIGAGTRIGSLGKSLSDKGQALPNMPDIDEQTLAGAMATGTHGTGRAMRAMHAHIRALRLVTVDGQIIDASPSSEPEIFRAAQVSLGALGVITRYTLANVPNYRLRRRVWVEPFDELLKRAPELAAKHRNFEFYYVPYSDYAVAIALDKTTEPVNPRTEEPDNESLHQLRQLRDTMSWWSTGRRWIINKVMTSMEPEEHVDEWWKIFPSDRAVRFNEMEYHMPIAALTDGLTRVRRTIEDNQMPVFFPVEVRFVKGDDAWLSPFHGRDSCSIAVHRFFEEDHRPYFEAIEPLFVELGGRPHWGKMHTRQAEHLARLYPKWEDFSAVRRRLDPEGRMLNSHLRGIFGVS